MKPAYLLLGIALAFLLTLGVTWWSQRANATSDAHPGPASEKGYWSDPKDAGEVAIRETVRRTLPDFWKHREAPAAGESDFMLKVAFAEGGKVEHMWVEPTHREGDRITGKLNQEPGQLRGMRDGQQVSFSTAEISDWLYRRDGKMVGNFGLRAHLDEIPEPQRSALRKMLAD